MINKNHHFCRKCGRRCQSAWVTLCNKHIGSKSASDKKIFHIPCPGCSHMKAKYAASYKVRRSRQRANRFECLHCQMVFTERTEDFDKIIPKWKAEKICEWFRIRKPKINKYDSSGKDTFSERELASLFKVSKSFVHSLVKKGVV